MISALWLAVRLSVSAELLTTMSLNLTMTMLSLISLPSSLTSIPAGDFQSAISGYVNLGLFVWNHKRIYRVYTAMKLNLRRKAKRRLPTRAPEPLTVPNSLGHTWSMDFMSDKLHNNIRFRTFNVIDDYNRELLGIDIGTSIPSLRVIRYLDQLAQCHGYPNKIRVDNGSEFTSSIFTDWAAANNILIDYIKPGCPYQNAYIERFNRSYRNEVLDCYLFNNLNEVRQLTDKWIEVYNHERPRDSLNDMTPAEFKQVA